MGGARRLYERFKLLIHEAAKFGIVGIVGVFVNLAISDWLHYGFQVGATAAAVVGAVVTTITSYLANRYWSFRHRARTGIGRETLIFAVLNGIGIAIQAGTVALVTHGFGLSGKLVYTFANGLGIVLGTVFRWWSYRKWVFLAPADAPEGHEALQPAMSPSASGDYGSRDEAGSSS